MTTEEKARAYDEAFESIKKFLAEFKRRMPKDVFEDAKTIFEDNFPELQESKDEMIRKSTIRLLAQCWWQGMAWCSCTREDILKIVDKCYGYVWLEFKMAEPNTPNEYVTKTLMKMFEYIGRALREEQQ